MELKDGCDEARGELTGQPPEEKGDQFGEIAGQSEGKNDCVEVNPEALCLLSAQSGGDPAKIDSAAMTTGWKGLGVLGVLAQGMMPLEQVWGEAAFWEARETGCTDWMEERAQTN